MKKELVILGHPHPKSYCHALADAYLRGAERAGKQISTIDIGGLKFEPSLKYGYQKRMPLEGHLERSQALIQAADHLVWVFPIWWATVPSLMKGFLDRVFLPGFAYEYTGRLPKKLLNGKTANLLITMDSPVWYYKLILRQPIKQTFVRDTLGFCGIKTTGVQYFSPIKSSSEEQRAVWLTATEQLGEKV